MDDKKQIRAQGARWRRLDNTAKLFAAVTGEELSNVFRVSVTLDEEIRQDILRRALVMTLDECENFRVRLRKGFFWYYFETNNREPTVEKEENCPCQFINPHAGNRFPFRVSFYGRRINFEVFHGLTDGLGALDFLRRLTENYLRLCAGEKEPAGEKIKAGEHTGCDPLLSDENVILKKWGEKDVRGGLSGSEDGYLRHYKRRAHRRYETKCAISPRGELLPLGLQSVIHGFVDLNELKCVCRDAGVSVTKYLTAALIWSVIQVYSDGRQLLRPAALNLPVNLRSFFETETAANFFSVVNIAWPAGKAPESFEEVLRLTGSQMDEQISKDRLEERISYNVSNEKKWYLRIAPLPLKRLILHLLFARSMRAYTMTFSNLGKVSEDFEYRDRAESFQLLLGVSARQRIKCGAIAFGKNVCITFTSALRDTKLQDFFFRFLEEQGLKTELESNGIGTSENDRGNYPPVCRDGKKIKKAVGIFYMGLFMAALLSGFVNIITYSKIQVRWSLLTIGVAAYIAMTLRFSVFRVASLAGTLLRQSLGIQVLLVFLDSLGGYTGWSLDYAVPCVIIFDVMAIVLLLVTNRINWQSYFMYQIAVTVLSFVPLLMWALGWVRQPFMAVLTAAVSVLGIVSTFVFGDKSVIRELKRRFHL